jgi:hypothetical protein
MFSLIRGAVIIGLIFYFSPARDTGESTASPYAARPSTLPSREMPDDQAGGKLLDGFLSRLAGTVTEDVVRTAAYDKAQSAGLALRDGGFSLPESGARTTEARRSADLEPAWRASAAQAVRCIYRCDGSE